jgi:hypothetical protein
MFDESPPLIEAVAWWLGAFSSIVWLFLTSGKKRNKRNGLMRQGGNFSEKQEMVANWKI